MLDPWRAVGQAPKPSTTGEPHDMAQRAATARKSEARALRRSIRGSTKTLAPSYLAEQDKHIRLGEECACELRLVGSLDIESEINIRVCLPLLQWALVPKPRS